MTSKRRSEMMPGDVFWFHETGLEYRGYQVEPTDRLLQVVDEETEVEVGSDEQWWCIGDVHPSTSFELVEETYHTFGCDDWWTWTPELTECG